MATDTIDQLRPRLEAAELVLLVDTADPEAYYLLDDQGVAHIESPMTLTEVARVLDDDECARAEARAR
jgi:hypothetical protein